MNKTRLVWFDRGGRRLNAVGPTSRYLTPAVSPDGSRLAVDLLTLQTETVDTWIVEPSRGVFSRSTFGSSVDGYPLWAPDGKRIVFASDDGRTWALREKRVDEAGHLADRVLIESPRKKSPQTWSGDRESLVYVEQGATTGHDLWLLAGSGDRKPVPLLQSPFNEVQAQLSPDGRWLAYTSDETGRLEVYIRSFPDMKRKSQISIDGGCQPRWRNDGKELYYLHGRKLLAVPIGGGSIAKPGTPTELFETHVGRNSDISWDYLAAPDGQRFLLKDIDYDEGGSSMVVVLNWQRLLGQ